MKALILIIALLIAGCKAEISGDAKTSETTRFYYEVVDIQSHQYIMVRNQPLVGGAGGIGVIHSESCPNSIHKTDTCKCN